MFEIYAGAFFEERIALEEAAVGVEARPSLAVESATYLWLSHFISAFSVVTDFCGLMQIVDRWTVCMRNELEFVEGPLTYARCQVSNFHIAFSISLVELTFIVDAV